MKGLAVGSPAAMAQSTERQRGAGVSMADRSNGRKCHSVTLPMAVSVTE